jgi:glyoxylase-like metal-dependent hydrolase (beta-lactamase superfamily II)
MRDAAPVIESTGRGQWTQPGVEEVAAGVHRVPLPLPNDGLRAVNVYLLLHPDGIVAIDSGWAIPDAREVFDRALSQLGAHVSDVRRFLVTHVHRDHYTQAISLRREFGARVSLGAGERGNLEIVMEPSRMPLAEQLGGLRRTGAFALVDQLTQHLLSNSREHEDAEWEFPDEWLREGTLDAAGRTLDVVTTPGHTQGHVVFHDREQKLLFAGDHVLSTITPSIGFEPVLAANPLSDFLTSLAKLRDRPDATLLPAHGPITDSVHRRIDELVEHHARRLDDIERTVGAGASTAFEVAARLRWTRHDRALDELDPFNQMLAVSETAAHLTLLVAQGRVSATEDPDVTRYSVGAVSR